MNKKKVLIISISILILALITVGVLFFVKVVSANQLSCSSSNTNSGLKIEQKYVIKYEKDKVNSISYTKSFAFDDQKRFDAFNSVVVPNTDSSMKKMVNSNIKFSSNVSGKTYTTTTKVNVSAASSKDLKKLVLDKSLTKQKANLEAQGLVCK